MGRAEADGVRIRAATADDTRELRGRPLGKGGLVEGLKNPTVVRDSTALDVFSIRPMGIREAIQKAPGEDKAVSNPA